MLDAHDVFGSQAFLKTDMRDLISVDDIDTGTIGSQHDVAVFAFADRQHIGVYDAVLLVVFCDDLVVLDDADAAVHRHQHPSVLAFIDGTDVVGIKAIVFRKGFQFPVIETQKTILQPRCDPKTILGIPCQRTDAAIVQQCQQIICRIICVI